MLLGADALSIYNSSVFSILHSTAFVSCGLYKLFSFSSSVQNNVNLHTIIELILQMIYNVLDENDF